MKQGIKTVGNFVGWIAIVLFIAYQFGFHVPFLSQTEQSENQEQQSAQETSISTQKEETAPVSLESLVVVKNSVKTPNAKLHVKNITSKKIDAMKITFYATDGFDEWIRKNGKIENEQIAQNFLLQPNDTIQCEWNLYGMDNGVNFMARVTAVHFSDGTTWHTTDDQYVSIARKSVN